MTCVITWLAWLSFFPLKITTPVVVRKEKLQRINQQDFHFFLEVISIIMITLEAVSNVLFICFVVLLVVSSLFTTIWRKRIKESKRKSILTLLWVVTGVTLAVSGITSSSPDHSND